MYEKENFNELKILPNDVHLVKSFSFFKNRVLKFLFDQGVANIVFQILFR